MFVDNTVAPAKPSAVRESPGSVMNLIKRSAKQLRGATQLRRAVDEIRFLLQVEFLNTGALQVITQRERISVLKRPQGRSGVPAGFFPKANVSLVH